MNFIDLHCDTAGRMLYEKEKLLNNTFSVDIEKLKKGDALGQVFAFYTDIREIKEPFKEFKIMYSNFLNELNANKKDITLIKSYQELESVEKEGGLFALLSIEEGEVLQGDLNNLRTCYEMGIRIITLTWNYKNSLGYPNYNYIYKDKGLTNLGLDFLSEMEYLGIIPDASHLSDGGFWSLIKNTKKPFIASHSNSRSIKEHPRNLSDEMIKALSNKGGVMGMNFCSDFIGNSKITKLQDIVTHIKHIKNVGGIDVIALGSDFDGIANKVEITDTSHMPMLVDALEQQGFTYYEIEKIFKGNAKRIFKDLL